MSNFNKDSFIQNFPINLAMDVLQCETKDELPNVDMSSADYLSAVYYALGLLNNKRYTNVILLRYKNHMSYDTIAQEIGVSKPRINQIVNKSIRILRHSSRINFIRKPMSEILLEKEEDFNRRLEAIRSEYEKKSEAGESGSVSVSDEEKEKLMNTHIAELELSVRAFNCLYRAKIYTVGDIMNKTYQELSKIRNMGLKSLEEVRLKLKTLGLIIPNESQNSNTPADMSETERIAAHNEATARYNMRKEEAKLKAAERVIDAQNEEKKLLESKAFFEKKVEEQAIKVSMNRFPDIFKDLIQGVCEGLAKDEQVISMLVKTQVIDPQAALPLNLLVARNGSAMLRKDDIKRLKSLLDGSVGWDRYELNDHLAVTRTSITFEPTVNENMVERIVNE